MFISITFIMLIIICDIDIFLNVIVEYKILRMCCLPFISSFLFIFPQYQQMFSRINYNSFWAILCTY
jgi:hypothetical protein